MSRSKQTFSWGGLLIAIIICQMAGAIGSLFTSSQIPTWYAGLVKPVWNPPGWIFGPVWTMLYTLMGIAAYRIWLKSMSKEPVRIAICLFASQLVFNSLWSIIFFDMHNTGAAFIEILMLLGLILGTTGMFFRLDRLSGYLMVPYILWVSFATLLTYTIWSLNP